MLRALIILCAAIHLAIPQAALLGTCLGARAAGSSSLAGLGSGGSGGCGDSCCCGLGGGACPCIAEAPLSPPQPEPAPLPQHRVDLPVFPPNPLPPVVAERPAASVAVALPQVMGLLSQRVGVNAALCIWQT